MTEPMTELRKAVELVDDDELYEIVRENLSVANADFYKRQIAIASEYLTEEQKTMLRAKGIEL